VATSKLNLYNGALRVLGETPLASLVENRESRRQLDAVWDDDAVKGALEAGQWLFATRSMKYTYSPSVPTDFGYRYAFNKPDDFVRTTAVCQDEYFNVPLTQYSDEVGFWFADLDTLFIKIISNGALYGMNMSLWPKSFVTYLEAAMARDIAMTLTGNKQKRDDAIAIADEALIAAKSQNAMADPAKFPPTSSWVAARTGGYGWGRRRNGGGYY